jgi:NADPH:quinone reductase-like Zn-dependent oxidoreductase
MLAAQFSRYGPPGVLVVAEAAEPHAGPGQVRIAVRAAGVTPADWYLRSGSMRDAVPLALPHIPGVDAAGIVDEIGAGAAGTRIGAEVFGLTPAAALGGAAAQFAVLDAWAARPAGPGAAATAGHAGLSVAAALAAAGRFTVPVHAVFPLAGCAAAPELSATRHARGKIVVTVP